MYMFTGIRYISTSCYIGRKKRFYDTLTVYVHVCVGEYENASALKIFMGVFFNPHLCVRLHC